MPRVLRHTGALWLAGVVLFVSCGSPPHKEIDQAQGAIDAAEAAGAERFATTELTAARTALEQANKAVGERDYRLALNYALESREQAQHAAEAAADTRARLRGDVERSVGEVKTLIAATRATLAKARLSRRAHRTAEQRLGQADARLQEVDAALVAEDFMRGESLLAAAREHLAAVTAILSPPASPSAPRRR